MRPSFLSLVVALLPGLGAPVAPSAAQAVAADHLPGDGRPGGRKAAKADRRTNMWAASAPRSHSPGTKAKRAWKARRRQGRGGRSR